MCHFNIRYIDVLPIAHFTDMVHKCSSIDTSFAKVWYLPRHSTLCWNFPSRTQCSPVKCSKYFKKFHTMFFHSSSLSFLKSGYQMNKTFQSVSYKSRHSKIGESMKRLFFLTMKTRCQGFLGVAGCCVSLVFLETPILELSISSLPKPHTVTFKGGKRLAHYMAIICGF